MLAVGLIARIVLRCEETDETGIKKNTNDHTYRIEVPEIRTAA